MLECVKDDKAWQSMAKHDKAWQSMTTLRQVCTTW